MTAVRRLCLPALLSLSAILSATACGGTPDAYSCIRNGSPCRWSTALTATRSGVLCTQYGLAMFGAARRHRIESAEQRVRASAGWIAFAMPGARVG